MLNKILITFVTSGRGDTLCERENRLLLMSHQEINLPPAHITTKGFSPFLHCPTLVSLISENKEGSEVPHSPLLHVMDQKDGEEGMVKAGGGYSQQTG